MLPVLRSAAILSLISSALGAQTAHDAVPDLAIGKRIFESQCTVCHGQGGTGGRGPALTRPTLAKAPDDAALRRAIFEGLPPEMPGAWQLSVREVASVAGYVRSLGSVKPEVLPGNAARGAEVYRVIGCSGCHILSGRGTASGPELTGIGARRNAAYLRESIRNPAASLPGDFLLLEAVTKTGRTIRGVRANEDPFTLQLRDPATGGVQTFRKSELADLRPLPTQSTMPPYDEAALPAALLEDLVAYLVAPTGAPLPESGQARTAVPYQRIVEAPVKEPGNWLTYSGNYQGHRYSSLTELTPANVSKLRVRWTYQFPLARTEVSPIVVDGVMYITAPNKAAALDLRTGRTLWEWERPIPSDYQSIGFGRINRGPAILGDKLFVTTLDCYVVALDLRSGQERWSVQVEDYRPGYSMTLAPLAIKDKVIVGLSGGEAGIRGFLDAYDAGTGKRAWRFYTIPGPGEKGHDTWSGESWKTGGGSTWVTGAYDPELNLVYWGIGNPGPDWNGDARAGDNLYTCSFAALDADTGTLRWHFQFTPHDTHDWDATHVPMLIDATVRGTPRKLIVSPNRNAFYYVLDRVTGEYLAGQSYTKQTWAKGLDDRGRPIPIPGMDPSGQGTLVWPSLNGATVWFSPSYSPATGLVYVSAREVGSTYYKREAEYKPGTFFAGGGETRIPEKEQWGAVRALRATTGELAWEFRLRSAPWAGVLSTAGGLVFSGTNEGNIFALDAKTGKPLWDFQAGGPVFANPISFNIDGRQHVALTADRVLYVFGL